MDGAGTQVGGLIKWHLRRLQSCPWLPTGNKKIIKIRGARGRGRDRDTEHGTAVASPRHAHPHRTLLFKVRAAPREEEKK